MSAKQIVFCIALGLLSFGYVIESYGNKWSSPEYLKREIAKTELEVKDYTAYDKSMSEANDNWPVRNYERKEKLLALQKKLSGYKTSLENAAPQPPFSKSFFLGSIVLLITGGLVVTLAPKASNLCKKYLNAWRKNTSHLNQIPKKLQTFGVDSGVKSISDELVGKICLEVVTNALGRKLNEGENVQVIQTSKLADGSLFSVFRYRQHSRSQGEYGSLDDKVFASVHAITLRLNRIGDYVNVCGVLSMDARDFEAYENPQAMISDLLSRSAICPEQPFSETPTQIGNSDRRERVMA